MCNLNILIKTKNNPKNESSFLMATTSHSFISNNDGDGIFLNNKVVKSKEKINIFNYLKDITKSKFILSHQRLSTSGFSEDYIQPFESKEFILVHNGIINDFLKETGSDTHGFFNDFVYYFNSLNGNRDENIVKTIKVLLDKTNGSFSIALFDKKANVIYYFKNRSTSIYFYESKNYLYITTNFQNDKFLSILNQEFKSLIVEDYKIYKIHIKEKIKIDVIGEIKKEKIKNDYNYGWGLKSWDCDEYKFNDNRYYLG